MMIKEIDVDYLQEIFENSINETCLIGAKSLKYLYANKEALDNMGYSFEQLSKLTYLDTKPDIDEQRLKSLLAPLFSNEKRKVTFETTIEKSNGERYPVEIHLKLINTPRNPVLMEVTLDISDRKSREKELKASNERFRLAMKAANEALWEWDISNNKVLWSEGYEKIFLRSAKEDINLDKWKNNIFRHDKEDVVSSVQESLTDPHEEFWQSEYRYIKGDSTIAWVEARGYILRDSEGIPLKMIGAMIDVTERKTFQEKIMESIIQTQEQERNRVAKDLHDGIVQELVACGMKAELIRLTKDETKRNEGLTVLLEQIKRTTNDVRNLLHGLLSADVHNTNISGLVERLAFQLSSLFKIHFTVHDKLTTPDLLHEEVKTNLYRAVQEITSNIIKHSNATQAIIRLEQTDNDIVISVKDDGIGIDSTDLKKKAGIGMYNIENRIKKISGFIEYFSPEDGGLQINIKVPSPFR